MPYLQVFCYLGSAMQDLTSVASAGKKPLDYVVTGVGIFLTICALLIVRRKVKQEMQTAEAVQKAEIQATEVQITATQNAPRLSVEC